MEHDPRFARESGRDVLDTPALILKGVLETPGGIHHITGCADTATGSIDPAKPVFTLAGAIGDRLTDHGIDVTASGDPAAAVARAAAVASIGGRSVVVFSADDTTAAASELARLGAGQFAEDAAVVVVCLHSAESRVGEPRLIAAQAAIPWIEPSDCQQLKDSIAVAADLSATAHRPVGLYVAPHLSRAWGVVGLKGHHATTVNARQRVTLQEARDLRQMSRRVVGSEDRVDAAMLSVVAEARGRRINRLDYRAQRGERVGLGFVVTGSLASVLAEALESLDLGLRFPTVTLGLTHPGGDTLALDLLAQCERVVAIEAGDPLIESHFARLAGQMETRDGVATEVWGRRFPFDHAGVPGDRPIDPTILIERIGGLLRAKPSLVGGMRPVDAESIDRALHPESGEPAAGLDLPNRTPTWAAGSTLRDVAAVLENLRLDLLETHYMHRNHSGAATALVVHADRDCARLLNTPPHETLLHGLAAVGTGPASSTAIAPLVTNRRVVLMSRRGFDRGGVAEIQRAAQARQDTAFVVLAVDQYATRRDGLPESDWDKADRGAGIERRAKAIFPRRSDHAVETIRIDPREWEPMRRGIEHAVFAGGVTVVIADPFVDARPRRDDKVRLEQAAIEGFVPQAAFDHIAVDVCENCLECARRIGCPSLRTGQTPRGPKLQIDRSVSVNDGAAARFELCPAFERVTVLRTRPPRRHSPRVRRIPLPDLPRPRHADHAVWRCCIAGVDGSGIERVARLLTMAGGRMGYHVRGMGRVRSAGWGGPWVDHVVFTRDAGRAGTAMIGVGRADLILAGDTVEAARAIDTPSGPIAAVGRTRAVVDAESRSTMAQVAGMEARRPFAADALLADRIDIEDRYAFPVARACEVLMGDRLLQAHALLGVAFQRGDLPLTLEALESAIAADAPAGTAGEAKEAFNMGRRIVANEARVRRLFDRSPDSPRRVLRRRAHVLRVWWKSGGAARRFTQLVEPVLEAMAERRVDEWIQRETVTYAFDAVIWAGGWSAARKYCRRVLETMRKDSAERRWAATRAVVTNLARAVLIKDEPYVAALLTSPEKRRRDRIEFRVFKSRGDRIVYRRDHKPEPVLLGRGFRFRWRSRDWQLRMLARCRWLRWLSPGWSRPQRQFRDWYKKLVDRSAWTTDGEYDRWVTLLRLPESCTGYREVLLPKLERVMAQAEELLAEFETDETDEAEATGARNREAKSEQTVEK